jgi:hypothetical protein
MADQPIPFSKLKDEIKKRGTILIDARKPEELKTGGKIPESKNLPCIKLCIFDRVA